MTVEDKIRALAEVYGSALKHQIEQRSIDMAADDKSHYLIYRVLGISQQEGEAIDLYQNKGRFLYRYAGGFLEKAAKVCLEHTYPEAKTMRLPNTLSIRPKTFEIDCLVEKAAYEIKWRDATTDGDHITKEHTRMKVIAEAGYTPIRLMFYYPNRIQAVRVQNVLQDLYKSVQGIYYYGEAAWQHLEEKTSINLKQILEMIVLEKGL